MNFSLIEPVYDLQAVKISQFLAQEFSIPYQLALILSQRGFVTAEHVEEFLFPRFTSLPKPSQLKGINDAVRVILTCCFQKLPIVIHGDYDVDGISATVLLYQFLKSIGVRPLYHIPNRLTEKYGLSIESIEHIIQKLNGRRGLIISVDCGISANDAIAYAYKQGFKVVITDHHEPPSELPVAEAIINPKQPGCSFPFKELSGVGVAFFLVAALRRELINRNYWDNNGTYPNLKQYLDLVALGTVADVMPLLGANRILVRGGLEVLCNKDRTGILALCEQCGLHRRDAVSSEDISFRLAPRINAAGRMGEADLAVELLLTDSLSVAREYAMQLDELNITRKNLEHDVLGEIMEECEKRVAQGAHALTIYHEDCHPGILGIVASRIAERFQRPAIVVTKDLNNGSDIPSLKGSGRSIEGLNLYDKLMNCSEHLEQFGGHPMAIGLRLRADELADFQQDLDKNCETEKLVTSRSLHVDYCSKQKRVLSEEFVHKLQLLQPFGEGNPEPLFMLHKQQLHNMKNSKGHLKFQLRSHSQKPISGIGFFLAERLDEIQDNPVDIVFKLKRSFFRGICRNEIQVVDIVNTGA
ncbi:single-stranded-DNA-specific exonuclease RecJ [Desulfogranum japonicum]|uniref:single-stranded-DNA-specific exonuclease RecJ n=1 Tax=Desulfogranum japonicum TaxID=231447 RepID=UPI0004206052|nr:single-stranded-DNA-specific exonuclease RecJ [Desulfogranum japonicum]